MTDNITDKLDSYTDFFKWLVNIRLAYKDDERQQFVIPFINVDAQIGASEVCMLLDDAKRGSGIRRR